MKGQDKRRTAKANTLKRKGAGCKPTKEVVRKIAAKILTHLGDSMHNRGKELGHSPPLADQSRS